MDKEVYSEPNQKLPRQVLSIYVAGFLVSLSIALPAYIFSSYLARFFAAKYVGVIFALASLLTIWAFAKLSKTLARFGNFNTTLIVLAAVIVSTALLAFVTNPALAIVLFVVNAVATVVIIFNLDIFLEHSSADRVTGEIRGTYLTFLNAAWVVAQLVVALIVTGSDFRPLLLIAALVAVPAFVIVAREFKGFADPRYHSLPAFRLFSARDRSKEVVDIYVLNFLLQFFYAWMVIYTPLYLFNTVGFSWQSIGFIFAVMLVPFVLVQRPLGEMADRILGEKELLVTGFLVMAVTTGLMTFISAPNFWLWMVLLFISRIGAATTEVMSETYFFKHVKDSDVTLIGLFRTTKPWAYIVSPIIATVLLPFTGIQYLFLCLALVMLYGAFKAFFITDTR